MSYLRYQRYPGILRFWYLPYRLDQVFSEVIPAIPTIPRYFDISVPYHTGSIRFFQQSYPRYPRVPRYFGTYHTSSIWYFQMRYPRYPCVPRYGNTPHFYRGNPGKYPTRCTTHGAAVGPNSTQRAGSCRSRKV